MSPFERIAKTLSAEPITVIAALCALMTSVIAAGSLTLEDYVSSIDFRTLILLFCLMMVVAGFREEGLLQHAAAALIKKATTTRTLALYLVACCYLASIVITNDVALIVFVPFSFIALKRTRREDLTARIVILQTIAANLGSSLSPIGNPQNIYLQSRYGIALDQFFIALGPVIAVATLCLAALLLLIPRDDIAPVSAPLNPLGKRWKLLLLTLLLCCALACVGRVLPEVALFATVCLVCSIAFRSLFERVDYALLLTFVFFFIFVANLQHIGIIATAVTAITSAHPFASAAALSQFISNVPTAILLSGFSDNGLALLAGANVGGLGTPIASLASLISLKLFFQMDHDGLKRYLVEFSIANFALFTIMCATYVLINL